MKLRSWPDMISASWSAVSNFPFQEYIIWNSLEMRWKYKIPKNNRDSCHKNSVLHGKSKHRSNYWSIKAWNRVDEGLMGLIRRLKFLVTWLMIRLNIIITLSHGCTDIQTLNPHSHWFIPTLTVTAHTWMLKQIPKNTLRHNAKKRDS